jgi:cyclic beta-1,2-glucan synthetase
MLAHHVAWMRLHELAMERRLETSGAGIGRASRRKHAPVRERVHASYSGEFSFDASALQRPLRPWINVLANSAFGVCRAGGGYRRSTISRLNQLTGWSMTRCPTRHQVVLMPLQTREVWQATPAQV